MKYLRDFSRETVFIHIRSGANGCVWVNCRALDKLNIQGVRRVSTPICTGAAGKALLPDDELQSLLNNLTFVPLTPDTIPDKETLLTEVKRAREQGYATSFGERTPVSAAISVPISKLCRPCCFEHLGAR